MCNNINYICDCYRCNNELYQYIENKYKSDLLLYKNYNNETAHKIFQIIILYYRDRINILTSINPEKDDIITYKNVVLESYKYNYNILTIKRTIDRLCDTYIQYNEIDDVVKKCILDLTPEEIYNSKTTIIFDYKKCNVNKRKSEQKQYLKSFGNLFDSNQKIFINDIEKYKYNIYKLQWLIEHELKKFVPLTRINSLVEAIF